MSDEYPIVNVSYQPVELCKLLKIANMVSGGGEAKIVISEGYVYLNGEVEFQKRKKIYNDDIIEFNGEVFQVACSNTEAVKPVKAKPQPPKNKKAKKTKAQKQQAAKSNIPQQTEQFVEEGKPQKRRPISF